MDWTEADGDTFEEAVEILLLSLGAHRSEVEIEEVGEKKKLFGLGKTVIRVRGRIKEEAFGGGSGGASIASLTSSLSSEIAKISGGGQQTQESGQQASSPERSAAAPQTRERPPRKRKKSGGGERNPADAPRQRNPRRSVVNPPVARVFGEGSETDTSKACKEFLERILKAMDVEGSVEAEESNGDILMDIKSDSGGLIIGRKGETLEALTKIMEIYATRIKGSFVNVLVDTEDYRNRREVKLKELAISSAEKAIESGKKVKLSPMKTDERKIVHFTLQDNPNVETRSEGRDDNRRIVIFPVRNGGN